MQKLIYNQRDIPKDRLRYGLRSSAATGCGWIATYNALILLGGFAKPGDLIRYYERQLPLIHGNFGTSFWGPVVCFRQWGFPVKTLSRREEFDTAAENADACILWYHWKRGARVGAHFVALQHTDRGFVGYNTYKNSVGPDFYGASLEKFLEQRNYFGCVLLAISRK